MKLPPPRRSNAIRAKRHNTTESNPLTKRYERVSTLGTGGEGQAILCRHRTSSRLVAVKIVKQSALRGLPHEARMLRDIPPHHHIIGYIEVFRETPTPLQAAILLEYCPGGDLAALIRKHSNSGVSIPESFLWHVFRQLSQVLAHLHSCDGEDESLTLKKRAVVHRDIKPANVLLTQPFTPADSYPSVKLADFGMAGTFTPGQEDKAYVFQGGTSDWQPPERPVATPAGDVWSVGAIVHALALGRPPVANVAEFRAKHPGTSRYDVPREVTPINAQPGREYSRKFGDTPYSDDLSFWMLEALKMDPKERRSGVRLAEGLAKKIGGG